MIQPERVKPFPVEVLPVKLEALVTQGAASLPSPVELLANPLLGVLGAAIGNTRAIRIKPGWVERPSLWLAVIAQPGVKKSPAFAIVTAPLSARQDWFHRAFLQAQDTFARDQARYERDLAAWKSPKNNAVAAASQEVPEKPEEPIYQQIIANDATMEALGKMLLDNPRGVIYLQDELRSWVQQMDAYRAGKGGDRSRWLSFWNGAEVQINRKGGSVPYRVNDPFVAVAGCLQPDVLGSLEDERGCEDGFIHRILFSYPEEVKIEWTDEVIDSEVRESYWQAINYLLEMQPARSEHGRYVPQILSFDEDATQVFKRWYNDHCAEYQDRLFPVNLRGPWAKMEGYCARLALVLYCARLAYGETTAAAVGSPDVIGAVELIDYFKSHARRVYARLSASPEDLKIAAAVQWIERNAGEARSREILRYKVGGVKDGKEAEALLRLLVKRGYGQLVDSGRKDSILFRLFTQRAPSVE